MLGVGGPVMPSEALEGPGAGAVGGGRESPPTDTLVVVVVVLVGAGELCETSELSLQAAMDTTSTMAPPVTRTADSRHRERRPLDSWTPRRVKAIDCTT